MTRLFLSLVIGFLVAHSPVYGAPTPADQFFDNLEGAVGDYHQAAILVATSPKDNMTDLEKHDMSTTLSVRKLGRDKYSLQNFTKGEADENSAGAVLIERAQGNVTLTNFDLDEPANSYHVSPATGASGGVELTYYKSAVEYLDVSVEAAARRKEALIKRQKAMGLLILVLNLVGKAVPAEVLESEDYISAYIVKKGATFSALEILLDPRGKSVLNPKGEPSLTIIQSFHKGH